MSTQMNAIIYTEYGSPDVLQFTQVEMPTPKDDEVLVRVRAASANPLDWHLMRATPFLARLENGLRKPKITRLGADLAGQVVAVGRSITEFKPGDEVFGETFKTGLGTFAEYVCVPQRALALKPSHISFEAAAAVPIAALTALQGLRNTGRIQTGQNVLVNGASGGVGSFAVQIAKALGAQVTGVSSTRNLDLIKSIGADHVIDYTREDFTRGPQRYDLIFDAVGNRSLSDLGRALTTHGICAVAGFTSLPLLFQMLIVGPLVSKFRTTSIGMMPTVQPNKQDLLFLRDLLDAGRITPVIDRCYSLRETAEAIRYLETGRARGKVIITVAEE